MKPNLPPSISSRQDVKAVIMELKRYIRWVSQSEIKQSVTQQASAQQPAVSPTTMDVVNGSHAGKPLTKDSLESLIKSLDAFVAKAPFVTVTLAAPAPNSLRQAIVSWFRQNVRPNLLVDFSFNSTMLGGMVVRYGSHVFDGSFKRQILADRAKFPEILRNV